MSVATQVKGVCFVSLDTSSKPNGAARLLRSDKPSGGVGGEGWWWWLGSVSLAALTVDFSLGRGGKSIQVCSLLE